MEITVKSGNNGNQLKFTGPMTYEYSRQIEDRIIDAMRRHPHLDVDLSSVDKIDLCGIHLLSMLKSYGGEAVHIVAASSTVEKALKNLPTPHRRNNRRRVVPHPGGGLTLAMAAS